MTTAPAKIESRSVRHDFTPEEVAAMHNDLLRSMEAKTCLEADLDQIKASFKAKITEAESRTTTLVTTLRAGFEMRNVRCRVEYRVKDREKDYYRFGCHLLDQSHHGGRCARDGARLLRYPREALRATRTREGRRRNILTLTPKQ